MIHRVLDLEAIVGARDHGAAPRHRLRSRPTRRFDEVLHTMIVEQHSRLPVLEGTTEKITGLLHYKDLLPVWEERRKAIRHGRPSRAFRVDRLLRPVMFVPETKPVTQMFDEFRSGHSHLAMVVDEFGTVVGMLTVEDVLEQIVGKIDDEHDERVVRRDTEADEVELDGTARIRDLESEYGIEIPAGRRIRNPGGLSALPSGRHSAGRRQRGARGPALHRARNGAQPHRPRADRKDCRRVARTRSR